MTFGVSTACFHGELNTEQSLALLGENGVKHAEIFLESYSEYTSQFGDELCAIKKANDMEVYSVHVYTHHFEPQLFVGAPRQMRDAEVIFRQVLETGQRLGARVYVMHGIAKVKTPVLKVPCDLIAQRYGYLQGIAAEYGIKLSIENVYWCMYDQPLFLERLRAEGVHPAVTLDVKQARLSGYGYEDYLSSMLPDLVNVHVSDYDTEGRTCMPGRGEMDYERMFRSLDGYEGQVTLELYRKDFRDIHELKRALLYVQGKHQNQ